jgi:hypothetical protein
MVIPHWNPRELLVALDEVKIGTVGSQTLAVVVQSEDLAVRQRDTSDTVAPAIVAIFVFVDVVSKMNNIVN